MQYRLSSFSALAFATSAFAAYIPSEPWSTLTPDVTMKSATTDYPSTFGIAVNPIATASASSLAKRQVTQIGDGQIQAPTSTASTTASTAKVITQIGDGQIQADTTTPTPAPTAKVITQIGDGQIQADTTTATGKVITQIGDGQIQADTTTKQVASQITDGQIQQPTSTGESDDSSFPESCFSDSALSMTLKESILVDSHGRIGSIVANRQFQFDGPPPQAGAIYAAGWSVTDDGKLALGNSTTFYQCLSGNFYNLYDQTQGAQCTAVELDIINLVKC